MKEDQITSKNQFSWPLVGNEHIKKFLEKSILNKKLSHAYIFMGPQDLGKNTLAHYFAQILLCNASEEKPCGVCRTCQEFLSRVFGIKKIDRKNNNIVHPDYCLIKKEIDKKNISIAQIRTLINKLSLTSFRNSYKIGIIKDADLLSQEAANALLKTLEEPPQNVILILLVNHVDSLPQTILSRSQILNFYPVSQDLIYKYLIDEYQVSPVEARRITHLSLGRSALAKKFLENEDFLKDFLNRAKIFTEFFFDSLNDRLEKVSVLLNNKLSGQELVDQVNEILDIWQIASRDLMLVATDQNHLRTLIDFKFNISNLDFLKISKNFAQSRRYLQANVNPRSVLEEFVVNL